YPTYGDIRRRCTTLDGVYAVTRFAQTLSARTIGQYPGLDSVSVNGVTVNYFTVLGTTAAVGRLFGDADSEQPGASAVVVLSHRFWTRRFNRDPAVVGQTLSLNGQPFII